MIDIHTVINALKPFTSSSVTFVTTQSQRNQAVIQVLKALKLDPTQPPKDVDSVYAYALVEYGLYKPEPIRNLFGEKEIKNAFGKLILPTIHSSFSKK
jgi:hypothetical protein